MSEPLQLVDSLIYRLTDSDGVNTDEINVTMWNGSRDIDKRAEGALRVLACVNACAGWSTLFLESVIISGRTLQGVSDETVLSLHKVQQQRDELLSEISRLTNQRDELLAALHNIAGIGNLLIGDDWEEIEQARSIANAAISKVEGEP